MDERLTTVSRRDFLRLAGSAVVAGAGVGGAAPVARAQSQGGRYELDNPQVDDPVSQTVVAQEEGPKVPGDPDVDVVYVITPPALHPKWTIRAAGVGKHVLSEKPMAPSEADCRAMIDACESAGRKLMIAYRVHYENHNRQVMQWSRDRKFGAVRDVRLMHAIYRAAESGQTVALT